MSTLTQPGEILPGSHSERLKDTEGKAAAKPWLPKGASSGPDPGLAAWALRLGGECRILKLGQPGRRQDLS